MYEILNERRVPLPGSINRRCRRRGSRRGSPRKKWREELEAKGQFRVAGGSVSEYERWVEVEGKEARRRAPRSRAPPLSTLRPWKRCFGYSLDWLTFGVGDPKNPGDEGGAADRLLDLHVFRELNDELRAVAWARGTIRPTLLRLLSEAERALTSTQHSSKGLTRLAQYLNAMVPEGDPHFLPFGKLSPLEREHVALHVRGLTYLLFRPLREADLSYVWSAHRLRSAGTPDVRPSDPDEDKPRATARPRASTAAWNPRGARAKSGRASKGAGEAEQEDGHVGQGRQVHEAQEQKKEAMNPGHGATLEDRLALLNSLPDEALDDPDGPPQRGRMRGQSTERPDQRRT